MQPYRNILRKSYIARLNIIVTKATMLAAAFTPTSDETISLVPPRNNLLADSNPYCRL